jgi:hydrogenase maturation protease
MAAPVDTTLVGEPGRTIAAADGQARVLVLGVGNLLMGDEGVGIHVLRRLEEDPAIAGVRLLDGGVAGIDLLEHVTSAESVIMVDATRDGKPAATIAFLRPEAPGKIPQGLSAHDFGLKDLFAAATLVKGMPSVHLFTISVETVNPMCMELSGPVAATVGPVASRIRLLAGQLAAR